MAENSIEEKKEKRWWKVLSAEFVIVMLLMFVALIVFAYAVDMVFISKKTNFDEAAFGLVNELVTPFRTSAMRTISFMGKHTFLIPAYFTLLGYFLLMRKRWFSIRVLAMALSSLSLMFLLKLSFQRSRPDIPLLAKVSGFSFPSGHALMSVVFYGLIIYIVWHETKRKWLKALIIGLLLLLILLISFSRIYLRVHYASDVIAGIAMGFIWLVVSLNILKWLEKRHFKRHHESTPLEQPA